MVCNCEILNPPSVLPLLSSVRMKLYYLHLSNIFLQSGNGILVTRGLAAHAILHLSHLAQQRFILHGNSEIRLSIKMREVRPVCLESKCAY